VTDKASFLNSPLRINSFAALRRVERRDCVNVGAKTSERPFPDVTGFLPAPRRNLFELFANFFFDFPEHDLNRTVGTAARHILFGPGTEKRTVGKARVFFFELLKPVVIAD
jgi:hypothetical protein